MDKRIIESMPELYAKLKPYVEYLESMGFNTYHFTDWKYFNKSNPRNYEYFNGWRYDNMTVADLAIYSGEPKIEVYTYKVKKYTKSAPKIREVLSSRSQNECPYYLENESVGNVYQSKIVDNINDFKKEIGKFFKAIKRLEQKKKEYDLEKDFT